MNCAPQSKAQWVGFIIWFLAMSLLEFWLGKTKKTEAGSVVEFALLALAQGIALFRRKKDDDSTKRPPTGS